MTMTPRIRKLALTSHVTASVGWVGALAVFFAHALASLLSQDGQMVEPGFGSPTSAPRWVKVFGAIVVVLVLLIGIMMLGGGHGPGAHVPSRG